MADLRTWQYRIRTAKGAWLGEFVLREDGFFATVSDWGSYAYWWTHHGRRDFREFVADLSPDYVASKIGRRDTYHGARTLRRVKDRILRARRDGALSAELARQEWTRLGETLSDWGSYDKRKTQRARKLTEDEFRRWYEETVLTDAAECAVYGSPATWRASCGKSCRCSRPPSEPSSPLSPRSPPR